MVQPPSVTFQAKTFSQILQQAQQDPAALADHMKNPIVRGKIQKLMSAGIIRTGPRY